MYDINYKHKGQVETVDKASDRSEAEYLLSEYNLAFGGGCYISQESTKEWREK